MCGASGLGGYRAQALGERGLLGTGMSDGDPLEAAASVDDVDHDHVRQPRSGEPRDALKAGPRFDRCGDDLACLHQELEPPLALCLLGPLGFEHDGDDPGGFAIRMFQRAQGGVYPHGRAVAAPDVETALPRSPAGRPLADLPREGDLIVGDDEVDARTARSRRPRRCRTASRQRSSRLPPGGQRRSRRRLPEPGQSHPPPRSPR